MSKKRILAMIMVLFIAFLGNFYVLTYLQEEERMMPKLEIEIQCDLEQIYQIYYSCEGYGADAWSEENSVKTEYTKKDEKGKVQFTFPINTKYIRLDLGNSEAEHMLSETAFVCEDNYMSFDFEHSLLKEYNKQIDELSKKNDNYLIKTNGGDSYLVLDVSSYDFYSFVEQSDVPIFNKTQIILCLAIDILCVGLMFFMRPLLKWIRELYQERRLVLNLAKNDFKTKYAGSYLGIIWAFVQPIVTIAVYTFVFQVGFRSGAVMDCPFVLWLVAGLVPWFFFSDALNGGTSSMIEYSYLVKKVVFKIDILPVVKVISALFVHMFFVFITIVLFAAFGYFPDLYTLQVIYYSVCLFVFVLSLVYATCAIVIFFRDFGQIISIFLQVGVWMTPIMWQDTMVGENYRWILKLNPIYYVVSGYRDALIDKVWFWNNPYQFVYFWFVTAVLFVLGLTIFKRLKVHFADVL